MHLYSVSPNHGELAQQASKLPQSLIKLPQCAQAMEPTDTVSKTDMKTNQQNRGLAYAWEPLTALVPYMAYSWRQLSRSTIKGRWLQ